MSEFKAFSSEFMSHYLPITIELGRSFVRPEYQSANKGTKSIFALDNLWDGLGALTVLHPDAKYLLGKMTMYPNYPKECRNMILYFLDKYFHDADRLVVPMTALDTGYSVEDMQRTFSGATFRDDYRTLKANIRRGGVAIPPLVNSYMNLSPNMKVFGTAINDEFGDVEETGILIAITEK